jgi:hypothetical protein
MDLLGNYSSSDNDDDSSDSERSRSPPTPLTQKVGLKPGTFAPSLSNRHSPVAAPKATKAVVNKRGKKLVSLHSVLPPHFLEQLTKSEAMGSFDDDDDDSSLDETKDRKPAAKTSAAGGGSAASQDEGIANFLSALNSAKTSSVTTTKSSTTNNLKKAAPPSSSNLGAAFLAVTSTTTTRKKKDGSQSTTATTTSAQGDEHRATPTVLEQQQQAAQGHTSPSHYTPLSLSPRTAFRPFRNGAAVAAAPPVPLSAAPSAPPPLPAATASAFTQPNPSAATAAAAPTTYGNKRSQKRQLQKALRAGQLDEALSSTYSAGAATVTHLDQAEPTAYVPQEETYAVPTHGVRVAATQMYNPKAGSNVQADLNRVKGKNQINHLMASAANFELQQARSGQIKNSQRAGAKRKYGW